MADIRPVVGKVDAQTDSNVESGPVSQKSNTPIPSVVKPTADQDHFRSPVVPAQSDRDKKAQESNDEIGAMIHKQEQTTAQTGLGAQDVPHTAWEANRMKAQAEADRQKQEAVEERQSFADHNTESAQFKEHAANPLKQINEHLNAVLMLARDMPNDEQLAILVQGVLTTQRQLVVMTTVKPDVKE